MIQGLSVLIRPALMLSLMVPVALIVAPPSAQAQTRVQGTITVENSTQLLAAIGSNRTIVLRPNTYDLSTRVPLKNAHLEFDKDTGGLIIKNVRNLRLIGADVRATKVLTSQLAANVLTFRNSQNIEIRSLELGHVPQSQAICLGAVLAFEQSRQIRIRDVNLFGSGTFGLWLDHTQDLSLDNSVIKECSQGLAFMSASRGISLSNSTFVNNDGGLNLWDDSQAVVSNSSFVHNHAERSQDYAKTLFEVKGKSRLSVLNSRLTDNTGQALVGEGKSQISFRGNYMIRNRYSLKP